MGTSALSPRAQNWHQRGRFVNLAGCNVYYQVRGNGTPVLMIHGYPYSSYDFHLISEELAKEHQVILFDLPGMGFSEKNEDYDYSFETFSNLVTLLLEHLQIHEVDVFAHDLGVSIVQELIAREETNSFQIRSIAFVNGGLFTDVYQPRLIQRILSQSPSWFGGFLSRRLSRSMIERSIRALFGPETQPEKEILDDWWSIMNYRDGKNITHLLGRLVFEKERYQRRWKNAMHVTGTPMIYICGPADPNSGLHMADRYSAELPGHRLKLLNPKVGHWPQLEAPSELVGAYKSFIIERS